MSTIDRVPAGALMLAPLQDGPSVLYGAIISGAAREDVTAEHFEEQARLHLHRRALHRHVSIAEHAYRWVLITDDNAWQFGFTDTPSCETWALLGSACITGVL